MAAIRYRLRAAGEADRSYLFESYKKTLGPYIERVWGWDEAFQNLGFWKHNPLLRFQVIMVDEHAVGGLHVEEDQDAVIIRMLFVLPEFQNRGIGSSVILDVLAQARKRQKHVGLKVIKHNPAEHLYRRMGFTVRAGDASTLDMFHA